MPEYRLSGGSGPGELCEADNPERAVWYAANPACSYWTDDWSTLNATGGIPCCPGCGCVGLITTFALWNGGAEQHEKSGNPRYVEFCNLQRNVCRAKDQPRMSWMDRYKKWLKDHAEAFRVQDLEVRLAKVAALLEAVVCTVGIDKGIILLSDDGPTHPEVHDGKTIQVYDHAYFSPLGDALIEAWELAKGEISK